MSREKNEMKGKSSSPEPLPMYQPVRLKHVPTMLRRRYDSHFHNYFILQDLTSNDGKSEGDGVEVIDPAIADSDLGDGFNDEAEDRARLEDATMGKGNTNQVTEVRTGDIGPSASMYLEDYRSEDDGPEDVNLANTLEAIDENRNENNGDNTQGPNVEGYRWDTNGIEDANIVSYFKDDGLANDMEIGNSENIQGLLIENCRSEGDNKKDVNVGGYYSNESDEDENQDEENENFDDKQESKSHKEAASYEDAGVYMDVQDEGLETEPENSTLMNFGKDATKEYDSPRPLPMYQRVTLKHVPTMVRRRYDKDLHKCVANEGWASTVSDVDDNTSHEAEDVMEARNGLAEFDSTHDAEIYTEDFCGIYSEDSTSEGDGAQEVNICSYVDDSVEDTILVNGHGKSNFDQDLPLKDGKSEGGIEDVDPTSFDSDVGDGVNVDADASIGRCDNNQDIQICTEDFGPSANMYLEDNKSEDDGPEDVDLANALEPIDKNSKHNSGHGKCDNVQGFLLEDSKSHKKAASYGDAGVKMDVQDEGLEIESENSATLMTFGKNATKGYDSPCPLPMYQRVTLKHVPTIVRRRYDNDLHKFVSSEGWDSDDCNESAGDRALNANPDCTLSEADDSTSLEAEEVTKTIDVLADFDTIHDADTCAVDFCGNDFSPSASMYSEDGESEGDEAEEASIFSSTDDNAKHTMHANGHEKSDSDQASCSKDCIAEDDEAKYVNFTDSLNVRVEDEIKDNELDLERYCVDDSAEDEVQKNTHGSSDNNHGFHIEDCKSEGDGNDAVTYYMDDCVKDEIRDKEFVNLDDKYGFSIQDVKRKGNRARDEYLATSSLVMKDHDKGLKDSNCGHDFNPEVFKKTLAQDVYVLCCPNCKRCITGTVIIRRKEKDQKCQTTCFSCIIALFRCIQW